MPSKHYSHSFSKRPNYFSPLSHLIPICCSFHVTVNILPLNSIHLECCTISPQNHSRFFYYHSHWTVTCNYNQTMTSYFHMHLEQSYLLYPSLHFSNTKCIHFSFFSFISKLTLFAIYSSYFISHKLPRAILITTWAA